MKPKFSSASRSGWRLAMLVLFFMSGAGIIGWRLAKLQIVEHADFADRQRRQREEIVEVPSRRGPVLDRRGEELAMSVDTVSLYAVPAGVDNPTRRAGQLARALDLPKDALEKRLRQDRAFVWLARKLAPETWKDLQEQGFSEKTGFGVLTEYRRRYPKSSLASQILGFVDLDEKGLAGVERSYEEYLSGSPMRYVAVKYPSGRVALLPQDYYESPPTGGSVTLTVDSVFQYYVERELDRIVAEHAPKLASIVVMRPSDGAILAMGSRPAADPNRGYGDFPEAAWKNAAVEYAYEPGSVFKVFVTASALEEGLVTPRELIDCQNGAIEVAGHRYNDHDPYATLSVSEIIAHSSNVGAIKIGRRFESRDMLYRRMSALGFGARSGIDLRGESSGLLRQPKKWSALSTASLSIGQEMSASPLQLVRAMAVFANGGFLVHPHVVEEARDAKGEVAYRFVAEKESKSLFSGKTIHAITRMMEEVIEYGTGKSARVEGYTVAGKTGTAQKADPATGRYADKRYVSFFVGFLPVEKPELVIAVAVDEPSKEKYFGGDVAAPAFGSLGKELMLQLGVPPSFGGRVMALDGNALKTTQAAARFGAVGDAASSEPLGTGSFPREIGGEETGATPVHGH